MKYCLLIIAFLYSSSVNAGFLDDLLGNSQKTNHINRYSKGATMASWYNDRSGRTASGMRATYGVAHRTLPFGTRVNLHNPTNGKSIVAVVTDRGPFVRGRNLDVNQNVARALGFHGVARLNMEVAH